MSMMMDMEVGGCERQEEEREIGKEGGKGGEGEGKGCVQERRRGRRERPKVCLFLLCFPFLFASLLPTF